MPILCPAQRPLDAAPKKPAISYPWGKGCHMKLLFQRAQGAGPLGVAESSALSGLSFGLSRPKFKLWAKIELEPAEKVVLDHYHFDATILIDAEQPDLMRKTFYVALATFIFATLFFSMLISSSAAMFWAIIAAAAAGYFYHDKHRETIFVRDLLHGRNFSCTSIIELARKEAWLQTVSAFLRQVMESAKNWDGTESIKIQAVDKDLAKQIIIKGL